MPRKLAKVSATSAAGVVAPRKAWFQTTSPGSLRAEKWHCRFGRQRPERRSTKPFGVPCHDVITARQPCRCCCHRVLEVGTRQLQGLLYDRAIDCRDSKHPQNRGDDSSGFGGAGFFLDQGVDCCDGMSRQQPFRHACFDRGPCRRASLDVWLPVQQDIEDYIDIEKNSFHRYFAARCLLYPVRSALASDPRTERRIGASCVTGEDFPATAAK